MKTISILGLDVKYQIEDTGKQKVLFVHGYQSSSKFIDGLWDVDRSYDIIVLDLPGNGMSQKVANVSIEFYSEIVKEFIKELGLKDLILLGHSMGGAISMFVSSLPEVKKTILLNPLNPYLSREMKKALNPKAMLKDFSSARTEKDKTEMLKTVINFASDYQKKNKFILKNQLMGEQWQGQELYEAYRDNASKAMVIASTEDKIVIPSSVNKICKSLNIQKISFEGAGHSPIPKMTKEFNDIFEKLIK